TLGQMKVPFSFGQHESSFSRRVILARMGPFRRAFPLDWVRDLERYWQNKSGHKWRTAYLRAIHKAWPELFGGERDRPRHQAVLPSREQDSQSPEAATRGYVYFFQAVGENLFKIGRTGKNPDIRRKALDTGC